MGQGMSCASSSYEHEFFSEVQAGDLAAVDCFLTDDPSLLLRTTIYDRISALHIAAANGRVQVLSMLLDRSARPDVVNRDKQAEKHSVDAGCDAREDRVCTKASSFGGKYESNYGRTCLHYTAYHGHSDCLQAILSAAKSAQVTGSWDFARFVNLRDGTGSTPLHLASRQRWSNCVHILLDSGALSLLCFNWRFSWKHPAALISSWGKFGVRPRIACTRCRLAAKGCILEITI